MITIQENPLMLDFIKVCIKLPQDEREQLEAFTGMAYDIDGAAVGAFTSPGPKWVIRADGEPIIIGGFTPQRNGVWRDFLLTTPEAWEQHWFPVTRICRRVMDAVLISGQAHRLECVSLASRTKAWKWYKILGYNKEGTLHGYCANGADAIIFSRVRH
jgi:hypothetical protein